MTTRSDANKATVHVLPVVSAREALVAPLEHKRLSRLRAIVRKLQRLGRAKGPNDPSLS